MPRYHSTTAPCKALTRRTRDDRGRHDKAVAQCDVIITQDATRSRAAGLDDASVT